MSLQQTASSALIDAGVPAWLIDIWAPYVWSPATLALALAGVAWVLMRLMVRPAQKAMPQAAEKPLPALGGPSLVHKVIHRPEKPVSVAGVTFDSAWRHIGIVATTGARKSTLLAMLAGEVGKPGIIITGDHAPPLENYTYSVGGWVWRARGGIGWYPWGGPLELAVQRAEYMQPKSGDDVGVGRGIFKQLARQEWGAADERGEPRTLGQLRKALPSITRNGQLSAGVAEAWGSRLRELEESLGSSLGTELDIVEAIRSGITVMISLNSFQDVSNRKRFASIAVLEALRAADSVGNIGVVIDEVGLVGADLFGDAVRTFRVRKVTGMFASQIVKDFPEEVRGNVGVWFLGQMSGGDRESRRWASDATFGRIAPEAFGEHALPQGKFYVVHGGRVETMQVKTWEHRLSFPPRDLPPTKWSTEAVSGEKTVTLSTPPSETPPDTVCDADEEEEKVIVREGPVAMPDWWKGMPWMNPADVEQLGNIWSGKRVPKEHAPALGYVVNTIFPWGIDGCHESTYRVNNRGRPMTNWRGEQWLPYALALVMQDIRVARMGKEEAEGYIRVVRMRMAAKVLTVEHNKERCKSIKCHNVEHLYWMSRDDNVDTEHQVRRGEAVEV